MRANKGEWSELYVLLRLLADGKLYTAGNNMEKLDDVYSPILSIIRQESDSLNYVYRSAGDKTVELYVNNDKIIDLKRSVINEYACRIYKGIMNTDSKKGAFEIEGSADILSALKTDKLKAPSTDKTDITVEMHDSQTNRDSVVGFSIKSDLGMPPTLLNPSQHTNFIYKLTKNISDEDIKRINSIETSSKIIDRIAEIRKISDLKYYDTESEVFKGNISLIDSLMDEILGNILLETYNIDKTNSSDLVTSIEEKDPLGYHRNGIYRYKYKKFLCAVALGMVPSKLWDGRDEANGGYIIVKMNGDVIAYHLYNRDAFETYLLNNTKLERASTSRYKYASLYRDGNDVFIKLNMQIRFL